MRVSRQLVLYVILNAAATEILAMDPYQACLRILEDCVHGHVTGSVGLEVAGGVVARGRVPSASWVTACRRDTLRLLLAQTRNPEFVEQACRTLCQLDACIIGT